jgi:ATPase subunit of ABC transporter with duplicated ATPase domains
MLQGGMVLVSHDFRLIDQVAKEIWVCEKQVRRLPLLLLLLVVSRCN